jgi:hypothetical protein
MNSVHVAREEKRWQQHKKFWGSGRQRKRKSDTTDTTDTSDTNDTNDTNLIGKMTSS